MSQPVVYIASDHRGFSFKNSFVTWLREHGYEPRDLGADSERRCDASDFAVKMATAMKNDPSGIGVLICGTGQAMAMTANRYQHIRAAVCANSTVARMAREHNDANVLALGANIIGLDVALDCLDIFLKTEFLGGRYADRRQTLINMGGL